MSNRKHEPPAPPPSPPDPPVIAGVYADGFWLRMDGVITKITLGELGPLGMTYHTAFCLPTVHAISMANVILQLAQQQQLIPQPPSPEQATNQLKPRPPKDGAQ